MPTKSTRYVVQRVVKSFPCLLGKDKAILSDAATSLMQRRNELKNAHKWTPGHKGSGRHTKVNNEPSAALYGLAIARAVMSDHGELFSKLELVELTEPHMAGSNLPGIASQFANQILGTANQLRNAEQKKCESKNHLRSGAIDASH